MAIYQDTDLIPVLGAGWRITDQDVVSADNQESFAVSIPSSCALRSLGVYVGNKAPYKDFDPDATMPPIGWSVLFTEDQTAGKEETLWAQPQGKIWNVGKCVGALPGGAAPSFIVTKQGGSWLLLLGGAAALYFLFKK